MDVEALVIPEIIPPKGANWLTGSLRAQMNKVDWLMARPGLFFRAVGKK